MPASEAVLDVLEDLKRSLGASSNAEVVRRCLAQQHLLLKAVQESRSVTIPGKNAKGKEVRVLLL